MKVLFQQGWGFKCTCSEAPGFSYLCSSNSKTHSFSNTASETQPRWARSKQPRRPRMTCWILMNVYIPEKQQTGAPKKIPHPHEIACQSLFFGPSNPTVLQIYVEGEDGLLIHTDLTTRFAMLCEIGLHLKGGDLKLQLGGGHDCYYIYIYLYKLIYACILYIIVWINTSCTVIL